MNVDRIRKKPLHVKEKEKDKGNRKHKNHINLFRLQKKDGN